MIILLARNSILKLLCLLFLISDIKVKINNICKRIIMIVLKSMIFRKDGYLIHIVDTCSVTFAFLGENA